MVNVKQHKVFPTIINEFEFDMDEQEYNLVIDELNDMEKFEEKDNLIKQTTDDLSRHIPKFTKSNLGRLQKVFVKNIHTYMID